MQEPKKVDNLPVIWLAQGIGYAIWVITLWHFTGGKWGHFLIVYASSIFGAVALEIFFSVIIIRKKARAPYWLSLLIQIAISIAILY